MIDVLGGLRIVVGLFILFFLSGYTFTIALFPRKGELDKEYDGLYKIAVGFGMSIVLIILTGFGLNSLGVYKTATGDYMGYVQTPYILAVLLVMSLIFFIIGWYRGGWPFMAKLNPKLARLPRAEPGMMDLPHDKEMYLTKLEKLGRRKEKLNKDIKDYERREKLGTGDMKTYYQKKIEDSKNELKIITDEMETLEQKISEDLY